MNQNEIVDKLIQCLAAAGLPARCSQTARIGDRTWHEVTDHENVPLCRLTMLPDGMVAVHCYIGRHIECAHSELQTVADALAGRGPADWRQFGFSKLECRSAR